MKQKEKEEYWERAKRTLPKDALVCLLRQNKNNKNKWESIRFGTINRREVKELAHPKFSEIGINFFSEEDFIKTLEEYSRRRDLPTTHLMVVSSSVFSYKPVLKGLKTMQHFLLLKK